ncbi:MAG: Spy/CpxP family protein refolding chaperone [candidate division Zixibacteria bacterium]|nr:Spy/CpxP family protein refolding chaperone [candidate division Zixibacteria bacterium]
MRRSLFFTAVTILIVASVAVANPGQRGQRNGPGDGMCQRGDTGPRGGGFGDGGMRIGMLLAMADEIGLDQKQKGQLINLHQQFGLQRIEMKAGLDKAEFNLQHLRMTDASEGAVLAAMDEVGELRTEMQKIRYQHRQKVKDVLTAEQTEKLTVLMKERRPMNGQGFRGDGQRQDDPPDAPRGAGRRGW